MKYGLIGERLGHSFSREIHSLLADYEYELREVPRESLHEFITRRDFRAINVTIPYKEEVIPYLHYIDGAARDIGAVNTVVQKDGKLYGYNTDFFGLRALIMRLGISLEGKKTAILGTGGTSRTASAVAKSLGAREIIRVSRGGKDGAVTYEELYGNHRDVQVIINTTPAGMYPDCYGKAVDISAFDKLSGVVDAVYNPLRTPLILDARARGIPAEGGLYMLVAQAVRASEIFLDVTYPEGVADRIYGSLKRKKENVTLVGMPASGKSTVGKIIAQEMGRRFVDTDELIEKRAGMTIPEIFASAGEGYFRELEAEAVREAGMLGGAVIATGGGAVLRPDNVDALRENGRIYFIDRPLDALVPTSTRPLSSDRESIEKRYKERYGIYRAVCDCHIKADTDAVGVARLIMENFNK